MSEIEAATLEREDDLGKDGKAIVARWRMELKLAEKAEKSWRTDVARILDIHAGKTKTEFNILWSNTQTLSPALYNRTPRPDVRRRHRDEDPTGKDVADVLERGLAYSVDHYDFDPMMEAVVRHVILAGRGVARVRYNRTEEQRDVMAPVEVSEDGFFADGELIDPAEVMRGENGPEIVVGTEDALTYETVECEVVQWDRFSMSPARSWEEVRWVAFAHRMTRKDLVDNFGAIGKDVNLNLSDAEAEQPSDEIAHAFKRAAVWEIWDKDNKEVVWIADDHDEPLDQEDDPLELETFFPIPRPLYSIPGDTMVPIPEYTIYEGQAKELDGITKRIKALTKALRVRGLYDGSVEELSTLLTAADETMIPVQGFVLAEKDGLSRAVQFMPLAEIAGVLVQLYQTREQTKNTIFEIIGISDILRGASKASETATAQNIKAQFGNLRLGSRQREVQRFARDLFRLKAEIMAEKFAPETLEKMTGKPISEEMLAIMQSDSTRGFRVDIETDSTIAIDEAAEQEAITELLTSVVTYMQGIAPLVQQGAFTKEAAVSLLLLAVRRFRGSREVEDTINSLTDKEQGPEAQAGQLEQAKQMIQQLQPLADENQAKAQEAEADRQLKREIETAKMNLEREKLGLKRDESLLVDKRERQKATAVISQKRETEHGNRLVALEGQAQRGFGG
jgi:hypothetical protein